MLFRHKKKEQLVDSEDNMSMSKCLCTECLTNPEEGLYCARGVTSKPIEQVRALGCSCAFCSIYHKYGLKGCYLCINNPKETS